MRSTIVIQGLKNGQPASLPMMLNTVDEHPGLIEFFEQVWSGIEAIYDGFTGNWAGAAKNIETLFANLLKDANAVADRAAEIEVRKDGRVSGLISIPPFGPAVVDHLMISFIGWSEDDLKRSHCFGRVVPATGVSDLGNRFWDKDDNHYFQQTFSVEIGQLATGKYALGFGAVDDGWFFDVGVVSNLILSVASVPATVAVRPVLNISAATIAGGRALRTAAPKALAGGLTTKHTGDRPKRARLATGSAVVRTVLAELPALHG